MAGAILKPFSAFTGVAVPMLLDNIDTDAIIPSREITMVSKTGLAAGLFANRRYLEAERRIPDPGFVLNDARYRGAQILLAGINFGCGSSREHAVWALAEYGFRALLAPSFNPIFHRNCLSNGVLPARLGAGAIGEIAAWVAENPPLNRISIDLNARVIAALNGRNFAFDLADEARDALLAGADAIEITLRKQASILTYIAADRCRRPWVYECGTDKDGSSSSQPE